MKTIKRTLELALMVCTAGLLAACGSSNLGSGLESKSNQDANYTESIFSGSAIVLGKTADAKSLASLLYDSMELHTPQKNYSLGRNLNFSFDKEIVEGREILEVSFADSLTSFFCQRDPGGSGDPLYMGPLLLTWTCEFKHAAMDWTFNKLSAQRHLFLALKKLYENHGRNYAMKTFTETGERYETVYPSGANLSCDSKGQLEPTTGDFEISWRCKFSQVSEDSIEAI